MPQPCTICRNLQRDAIDRALVEATPKRLIAAQHGLAESALRRHAAAHLPKALVKETEAQGVAHEDDLVGTLQHALRETHAVLEHAKATGNWGGVLQAIDRIAKCAALLATLAQSEATQLSNRFAIAWIGDGCPHHPAAVPQRPSAAGRSDKKTQ
ncbi:MAG TPA: hypothetical protein VK714_08355 [Myxococcota bacterium]|nr:hypothetical protein [Myxococcota bacterium]